MGKIQAYKKIREPWQTGGLIGIPFVDGGRDRKGIDCWGLVLKTFEMFNINIPDYNVACTAIEAVDFSPKKIGQTIEDYKYQWNKVKKPYAPVLITMGISDAGPKILNHLGVYIGSNIFIHTLSGRNSSIAPLNHMLFKKMIEGFYEYIGN